MDEEKQNDGMIKKTGDALKKGAKKQAKDAIKKVVKKVIMAIMPYLLKAIAITLIITIIITAIADFFDKLLSPSSKQANAFAVKYTASAASVSNNPGSGSSGGFNSSGSGSTEETPESSLNSIIVDINNVTENGAYKLTYEFKDENGNLYSDEQAIINIKSDLLKENEDLDLTQFSNSELKIIGTLMYNGLYVEDLNEAELKALALFVKADIASQSIDLRSGDNTNIDIDTLRESDEIYGTIQLHKTTIVEDGAGNVKHNPISLQYVPYGDDSTAGTFCYMVAQKDEDVLSKFSLDNEGNLVVARWSSNTITYTYLDESENLLSDSDKQKISKENIYENVPKQLNISLYPLPINYKQYIAKYTTNYGFLSDLLITTDNVDFCEDIAQMAFNSKIVFNLKEELTTLNTVSKIKCTQTNLIYDYVKYEVSGQKESETPVWEQETFGTGTPSNSTTLQEDYGWKITRYSCSRN